MKKRKSLVEEVMGNKPSEALDQAADYWIDNTLYYYECEFSIAHIVMEAFQAGWKTKEYLDAMKKDKEKK